ncbi:MAG TPA: XTP/dITP diphosphatase [Tepidisphaeraceae bacterium]|nr:XTP/dITP diphosphatase [Tepidisphaeraceae bacterium]
MDLLIATANAGKIREFRQMLGGDRFSWHDLSEFPNIVEVPETGDTFHANACLKAAGYATQANMWALADDSGLEVDALAGKPGVYSARWAAMQGTGAGDADNNATLLRQLETVPDEKRTARFVCVLALANHEGRAILTARDTLEGRILRALRGSNGFGYDPLFYIDELGQTTAQLSPGQKHQISHRGKALRRMREMMERELALSELM